MPDSGQPKGRTPIKGGYRAAKKFVRTPVTNEQKLHTIRKARECGMASAIRELFPGLTSSQASAKRRQVYRWVERGHRKTRDRGHVTALPADAEEQLVFWINDFRKEGLPVSPRMLAFQAREIAIELGISRDSFSASWCWRKRFLVMGPQWPLHGGRYQASAHTSVRVPFALRFLEGQIHSALRSCDSRVGLSPVTFLDKHHLSVRCKTRIGQKTPEDSQQVAAAFSVVAREAIIEHDIAAAYNADQTAMNYEYLPSHTISEKGERTVWVCNSGVEKSRMTVMLLADSSGNKRPPFAVLKQRPPSVPETQAINHERQHGFGRGVWAEISRMMEQTRTQIYCNGKGWWNSSLSVLFLKFHFGDRTNMSENILLMWDDFSGHWTKEVRDYAASISVVLLKIPAGYTSVCWPVDMTWTKPLEQRLRDRWVRSMEKQLRVHHHSDVPTSFKLLAPKRRTVIDWLHSSWAELSTETISSGFKKLMIASSADESLCQEEPLHKVTRSP